MRKLTSFILILMLTASLAVLLINVPNHVKAESETWSGVKILTEDYIVNEAETLTIEPGTTVYLAENVKIKAYGVLKAEGTADNMITFTRYNTTGYWGSIRLLSSSTNYIIKYCKIEYAGGPSDEYWGAIYCNCGPGSIISNNSISNCEDFGINCQTSNVNITYNWISNTNTGIYCTIGAPAWISPTIFGNVLKNNYYGIQCCHRTSPTISHNLISENTYGVYCIATPEYLAPPNPTIHYNNIYGNTNSGVTNQDYQITRQTIDAAYNWWGSADGPSGEGPGGGDAVSKGVDYSNYLTEKKGYLPPTAKFSYSLASEIQTIQFTDESWDDVNIVSRNWDFGDENTSTTQNPAYQYLIGNKTYTVALTVTDNDGNVDQCLEDVFVAIGGPDLDGDGIPDELDDDRDGDGVLNENDAYPDDQTKSKEEVAEKTAEQMNPVPFIAVIAVIILVLIGIVVVKKPEKNKGEKIKPTVIDEIFLMYNDGRLIKHFTRRLKPDMDEDILSSMLVAVQNFVKDSFKGEEGGLDEMKFGELKIIIGRGKYIIIAAVILSEEAEPLRPQIASTIKHIEWKYKNILKKWDGNLENVRPLYKHMEDLIAGKYR